MLFPEDHLERTIEAENVSYTQNGFVCNIEEEGPFLGFFMGLGGGESYEMTLSLKLRRRASVPEPEHSH